MKDTEQFIQESAKLTWVEYQGLWRLKEQWECGKEARIKDRYVTFLSDGDPSSFKAVCNMNNINGLYPSQCCEGV